MGRERSEDDTLDLIQALPEPLDRGPALLPFVLRELVRVQDRLGPLPEVLHCRKEVTESAGFVDPATDFHDPLGLRSLSHRTTNPSAV